MALLWAITYPVLAQVKFPESAKTYQLVNLQDAGQKAPGTNVKYSSSNPKIVQVDENTGALRFINTGLASITATSGSQTAKYNVTIAAEDAEFSVSGHTYTLTKAGKLGIKTVNNIPGIKMEFGSSKEITVVRNIGGGLGATTIDINGYSWIFKDGKTYPTWGSYYKFSPTTNGTLTVKGYFQYTSGNTASEAKLTTSDGNTVGSTIAPTKNLATGTYTLEAGKEYYLYTEPWSWFNLSTFTFDPSFEFTTTSVVLRNGENTYTQAITGIAGVKYAAKFLGDVAGKISSTTGKVDLTKRDGGAVIVTATLGTASTYYVITVPYTKHKWEFNSTTMPTTQLFSIKDGWGLDYRVKTYKGTTLTYLNIPVAANGYAFSGTNAYRINATAGLLFDGGAKTLGARIELPNQEGTTLDEKLNADPTTATSITDLALNTGGRMTIPALKKGQYIKIHWARHADGNGELFKATNLTDLDGKPMTDNFDIGTPGKDRGYALFTASADGDVTLTSQNGWAAIQSVEVYAPGEEGKTDIRVVDLDRNFENHIDLMVIDGKAPAYPQTKQYSRQAGVYTYVQAGLKTEYSMKSTKGVDATITPDGLLTVNGGYGTIVVTLKNITNVGGYTTDKIDQPIAINLGYQTTIKYPYTWNFEGRNEAGRKIPSDDTFKGFQAVTQDRNPMRWIANADGNFGLRALDELGLQHHVPSSELWIADANGANGRSIRETRGLRITLDKNNTDNNNNQIQIGNSGALSVGNAGTQQITLPGVPAQAKIYVRATKGANAVLSHGANALTPVQGTQDVYMTQAGAQGDVTLNVKDIDIYQIGVSIDDKTISAAGAATEARSYPVNYDLAETFLGKGLKAYTITGVNADNTQLNAQPIARVAEGVGVMLKPADKPNAATTWPLFTTDINDNTNNADGNKLIGVVQQPNSNIDQSTTAGTYNYMLAQKGYSVHYRQGASTGEVTEEANGLGFYLVLKQGTKLPNGSTYAGGKPKANSAYLQLPTLIATHTGTTADNTPQPAKRFYSLAFIDTDTETVTAIEKIQHDSDTVDTTDNSVADKYYYTLSGVRVERPSKGIYIHRGKKIVIR